MRRHALPDTACRRGAEQLRYPPEEAITMEQAVAAVRDLARRLLALEAAPSEHAEADTIAVLSVLAKLRAHLSKLVGVAGYQALLSRALALAKTEAGWLGAVRVQEDATFANFRETAQQQSAEAVSGGSAVLLAYLLGLLVTFIGEALTLRLARDIWPEAQLDANLLSVEEARHE